MKNFTNLLKTTVFGVTALAAGSFAANAEEVKMYNWADYIHEEVAAGFEAETGIKLLQDYYDSVEIVDAKLLAGKTGYDVIVHSSGNLSRLIAADIILKLDKSKLPNMKHMRPDIMALMASNWDSNNEHILPYMWGTHGVTFDKAAVDAVLPNAPYGSAALIFDPANMEKLSKCGVAFLDSPDDMIPMAMKYLGLDPYSTNRSDYKKVDALFASIRPYVKAFGNYEYTKMAESEYCITTTWGPDGLFAQGAVDEAGIDMKLDFFAPKEGANLWVDSWAIPNDADNIDGAHKFINYMMRPDVSAAATDYTWYANANADATALVDPEVTGSPAAYPTDEAVASMYTYEIMPPKIERTRTRTWSTFKSGS